MSEPKKSFLDSNLYPILFMLAVTIIFVGILSVFYRSTEKRIQTYKDQTYQLGILSLFADTLSAESGIKQEDLISRAELAKNFTMFITEKQLTSSGLKAIAKRYYAATTADGKLLGYCFDLTGSGLWGTMRALIAVTPDFSKIINFSIYDQMETPGLGARVEELWFKNQFKDKPIVQGKNLASYALVPEEAAANQNQVKQITGATITSASVLTMLDAAYLELSQTFDFKSPKEKS
jgi:Na+-transporting NADH:ubiquinone oxidoreductase subunit C